MFAYIPYELKLVQALLSLRIEALNPIFIFLNHLDSGLFYCLVGVFAFTCLNPRLGIRCFILLAFTIISNYFLKNLFGQPRPLILDPSLGLIVSRSAYGLPSGGAQGAMTIAIFFLHYFYSPRLRNCIIGYVLLCCFTRVYIGMHFISDVVVGCLLGYVISKFSLAHIDDYLVKIKKIPITIIYSLTACIFTAMVYFDAASSYQYGFSMLCSALACEYWLSQADITDKSLHLKILSLILGIVVLAGINLIKTNITYYQVTSLFLLIHSLIILTKIINKPSNLKVQQV